MTVSSGLSRTQYAGVGNIAAYPVPFAFLDSGDLVVIYQENAQAEGVALDLGADFTVSGAGDASGGFITSIVAWPTTSLITIVLAPTIRQLARYVDGGRFPAASHERALDLLTMICARLSEQMAHTVRAFDVDAPIPPMEPASIGGNRFLFRRADGSIGGANTEELSQLISDTALAIVDARIELALVEPFAALAVLEQRADGHDAEFDEVRSLIAAVDASIAFFIPTLAQLNALDREAFTLGVSAGVTVPPDRGLYTLQLVLGEREWVFGGALPGEGGDAEALDLIRAAFIFSEDEVELRKALVIPKIESEFAPALIGEDRTSMLDAVEIATGRRVMRLHQSTVDGVTKDNILKIPKQPESHVGGVFGADLTSFAAGFDLRDGSFLGKLGRASASHAFSIVSGRQRAFYGSEFLGRFRGDLMAMTLGTRDITAASSEADSWGTYRRWITDASRFMCDAGPQMQNYGYGGHGWWQGGATTGIRDGYEATYTGTWSEVPSLLSPHQHITRSSTPGDLATFFSPFGETDVTVIARRGAFRWRFGLAGPWTDVVISGDSQQFFTLAGVLGTLQIETVTAPFDLIAIRPLMASGFVIDRLGRAGTSTKEMVAVNEAVALGAKTHIAPSVCINMHTTNDQLLNGLVHVTPQQAFDNQMIWGARQRAATPNVPLLIINSPKVRYEGYPQEHYVDAYRQAAVQLGCAHLDLQPLFGDYEVYKFGGPRSLFEDAIHPNQLGDNILIYGITAALLGNLS